MNKSQKKTAAVVGASIAALGAATAASVYFFGGKGGAKNRAKVSKWADKAKKEIMEEIKAMENVTKTSYNSAVDAVTKQYRGLKNVDPAELQNLAKELKGHWDSISGQLVAASKKVVAAKKITPPKAAQKKAPAKKPAPKAKAKK